MQKYILFSILLPNDISIDRLIIGVALAKALYDPHCCLLPIGQKGLSGLLTFKH